MRGTGEPQKSCFSYILQVHITKHELKYTFSPSPTKTGHVSVNESRSAPPRIKLVQTGKGVDDVAKSTLSIYLWVANLLACDRLYLWPERL